MIQTRDQQILSALDEALEEHTALGELLQFYREIYQAQFAIRAELPPTDCPLDEAKAERRLEAGQPLISFQDLKLTPETFGQAVEAVSRVVAAHNPEWRGICDIFAAEELLEDAQQQFQKRSALNGPQTVCSIIVTVALTPFIQHQGEACRPLLKEAAWGRGYCPMCGGWPQMSFLEREAGARQLHCARCDTFWRFDRVACPFCGRRDVLTFYASEDKVYRLEICQACRRYLKTVDLRHTQREPDPLVERLVTLPMDLTAQEQGYGFHDDDQGLEGSIPLV